MSLNGGIVVAIAQILCVQDPAGRIQRIHGGIDPDLRQRTRQHDDGVQVTECSRWCRICEVVGRFFKTMRDSQLYKIKSYSNNKQIKLRQTYSGPSLAGNVNIFATDLTVLFGNPHITHFTENMAGLTIYVQGTSTPRTISAVDEEKQQITLTVAATTAGNDLTYSIQDKYQIDPPGLYVMTINPTPTETDKVITIDYTAIHTDLTGDDDEPMIPRQFHYLIEDGSAIPLARIAGEDAETVSMMKRDYERELLLSIMVHDDPLDGSFVDEARPDPLRHRRTGIAR